MRYYEDALSCESIVSEKWRKNMKKNNTFVTMHENEMKTIKGGHDRKCRTGKAFTDYLKKLEYNDQKKYIKWVYENC